MSSKPAAVIAAIAAAALGLGAFSVFRSGDRGYLALLGLILALGALALLFFAARLYTRAPQSSRRRTGPIAYSGGQRLGLIALAVLSMAFGTHALLTGKSKPSSGSAVSRAKQPGEFWQMVLLYFGTGGALLYLGLRKPPADRGSSDAPSRDERERWDA
jgi:O-antigen/teichoic acid export membrane protein